MISKTVARKLMREAIASKAKSYSPYSRVVVGAALLSRDGRVFTGANIENASYGLSMCAERIAAVSSLMSGSREWVAIAVAFGNAHPTPPCGACCQFLAEFVDGRLLVIWGLNEDSYETAMLRDLFPKPFASKMTPK